MKKTCLLLIILSIFTIIFIMGCGGGDGITPSVDTPTSNDNGQTGSLVIKIKWPQPGIEGSCIFTTEDFENTLMASMPCGTNNVSIEIYEAWFKITDEVIENLNKGWYRITENTINELYGQIDLNIDFLVDKGFSKEDLIEQLRDVSYDDNDIALILEHVTVNTVNTTHLSGLKNKEYCYTDMYSILEASYGEEDLETILEASVFYNKNNPLTPLRDTHPDGIDNLGLDTTATKEFSSLPLVWVTVATLPKVKDEFGNVIKEFYEEPVAKHCRIKAKYNVIGIDLGDEQLALSAIPAYIALSPDISSSMMVEPTPIPELTGETQIVAKLVLESPDIPDQPPPPTYSPKEDGNIESQGEWGLKNYEVEFTIIDGTGELIPIGSTDPNDIVTSKTDEYGNAGVFLRTDTPGIITVQASCQLDPDDPESVIISTCEVEAVTSTSVEDAIYQMNLTPGNGSIFHTDFSCPDIPDNWARSADISAVLEKINFTTGSPEPAPNMEISWSMTGDYGSLIASSTTDGNGISTATLDVSGEPFPSYADGYQKIVTLKAQFTHPYKSDNIIVKEAPIYIDSKTAMADTFEKYELGTKAYDLYVWWTKWQASGSAGSHSPYREESEIVSPGAFDIGQAIKLYSPSSDSACIERHMGYWYLHTPESPWISTEVRFCVKVDAGLLTIANVYFRGIGLEDAGSYLPLITFNNELGVILDANREEIMSCTPEEWYSVRVQLLADKTNPLEKVKVNYWFGNDTYGEFKKEIIIRNLTLFSTNEKILTLEAKGGTAWFDEVDEIPVPSINVP